MKNQSDSLRLYQLPQRVLPINSESWLMCPDNAREKPGKEIKALKKKIVTSEVSSSSQSHCGRGFRDGIFTLEGPFTF